MKEKFCKGCEKTLSISEYGVNRATRDGLQRKCKKCINCVVQNRYTLSCEQCGSSFGSHSKKIRFCGNECAGMARRKRTLTNCSNCKCEIEVKNHKLKTNTNTYCSNDCKSNHKSALMKGELNPNYNRIKSNCAECGSDILVTPSRMTKSKNKYCGKECMYKNLSGEGNPNFAHVDIQCTNCGKEIRRARNRVVNQERHYCCHKCFTNHRRARHMANCKTCGKEFHKSKKRSTYCSLKCFGQSISASIECECSYCGADMVLPPSRFSNLKGEKIFCSKECRFSNSRVEKECASCGNQIAVTASKDSYYTNSFCSITCHNQYKRDSPANQHLKRRVSVHCSNCGASLERRMFELDRENHYCSIGCRGEHMSRTRRGENHPMWNPNLTEEDRLIGRNYQEYVEWRSKVYKRDNSECQCCGSTSDIHAHHIYNYADFPGFRTVVSNGICLCEKCHTQYHSIYGKKENNPQQLLEFLGF